MMDAEILKLLKKYKTITKLIKESEGMKPLDLDRNPEFVADFMKGMLIEDILKAMEENDISKTQLAERLGKSRQYVTRILNETANFTLKSIAEITCALDMQVQTRIYRQDEVLNISSKLLKVEVKNFNNDNEYRNSVPYQEIPFSFVKYQEAV